MQLNQGKFRQNGACGYILKPEFMFNCDNFDPFNRTDVGGVEPVSLVVRIIGARHLTKSSGRGIVSPFVEVEIAGVEADNVKLKTGLIRKYQ